MDRNDNHFSNETQPQQQPTQKRKPFLNSFWGGILGGVLSALLIIGLFLNGTSDENSNDSEGNEPPSSESSPATQVSTSKDTELEVDEISQAIVGVVNVQQKNIWAESEDENVGSGIIYKKEDDQAYVVTNNHVVKEAEEVEVEINQDERINAKVLGNDELSDLAVLEIDAEHVEYVADLGSSEDLQVSEIVYAIGNPLGLDFTGSVTKGIISGLDRSVKVDTSGQNRNPDWEMEVIQTDAAINPGNSGGALVNTEGQVIGINSMKIAQSAVEGIGFSIPIDAALPIMEQLEKDGEVVRPSIGIAAVGLNEVPLQYQQNVSLPEDIDDGVVIADVEENSPASEAGLEQFDVVTKIDDTDIESMLDLRKYLYLETDVGDSITMEIYRDGEKTDVTLELTE